MLRGWRPIKTTYCWRPYCTAVGIAGYLDWAQKFKDNFGDTSRMQLAQLDDICQRRGFLGIGLASVPEQAKFPRWYEQEMAEIRRTRHVKSQFVWKRHRSRCKAHDDLGLECRLHIVYH